MTLFLGGWHAPISAPSLFVLCLVLREARGVLFVFIWIRGMPPRARVDHVMGFAWKFMLPMAFTRLIAAAVCFRRTAWLDGLSPGRDCLLRTVAIG